MSPLPSKLIAFGVVEFSAPALPTCSVPSFRNTPPVKVLLPLKIKVPGAPLVMAVLKPPVLLAIVALMVNGCGVVRLASIIMTMSELAVVEGPISIPVPGVSLMIEPAVALAVVTKMPPSVHLCPFKSMVARLLLASR